MVRVNTLHALPAEGKKQMLRAVIAVVTAYRPKARGRSLPVEMTVETRVATSLQV